LMVGSGEIKSAREEVGDRRITSSDRRTKIRKRIVIRVRIIEGSNVTTRDESRQRFVIGVKVIVREVSDAMDVKSRHRIIVVRHSDSRYGSNEIMRRVKLKIVVREVSKIKAMNGIGVDREASSAGTKGWIVRVETEGTKSQGETEKSKSIAELWGGNES
jgi:hypothetical protein